MLPSGFGIHGYKSPNSLSLLIPLYSFKKNQYLCLCAVKLSLNIPSANTGPSIFKCLGIAVPQLYNEIIVLIFDKNCKENFTDISKCVFFYLFLSIEGFE